MHQADSLYFVNDMANSLRHLLVVFEHAQKEDNQKIMLEAIHLLCQIEESLGFTELLSKSARMLIKEAERSEGIDDVNYYLSLPICTLPIAVYWTKTLMDVWNNSTVPIMRYRTVKNQPMYVT